MTFEEAFRRLKESPEILTIFRKGWKIERGGTYLSLVGKTLYITTTYKSDCSTYPLTRLDVIDIMSEDWEVDYSNDKKEAKATHSNFRIK